MAIYHLSSQTISRSKGRSSVAASSYRASEKLIDERTGLTYDFSKKQDVIKSDILLPKGAPEAMKDRQTLWNAVEQGERRKDAQVAREINIALPRELSPEQNWSLAVDFVKQTFVSRGMIADVAFHSGHRGNEDQPHVHVMLTLREVTAEGFGFKVRAWNDKALLCDWREQWADYCNRALARAGIDQQIDHRTLVAQGINLEPQSKIGAKAASLQMARYAEHQALAQRNGERLLADPSIALTALTRQQSTFTHQDIARFVNRHTVNTEQFQHVFEKVKAHPEIVLLGQDNQGRDRYSTQTLLDLESTMFNRAQQLAQSNHFPTHSSKPRADAGQQPLSDSQIKALDYLNHSSGISCLIGVAGSGKSTLLGEARAVWEANGYRVQGMALAGIAADQLSHSSGIASATVASRLWRWEHGYAQLSKHDVVVVDEAGMLGTRQLAKIVETVHQAQAKLVLVGDPEQLQAIEAGAAFRLLSERLGATSLTEVYRQHQPWQREASQCFAGGATLSGLNAYHLHGNIHQSVTKSIAMTEMLEAWDERRQTMPKATQLLLAYTREDVRQLNTLARTYRQDRGELGEDHLFHTSTGLCDLAEHDRIYFLRKDTQLGVQNGTLGTIEAIQDKTLKVRLDTPENAPERTIWVDTASYNSITAGYAATVYKAQGATVDYTHVLASRYFDRHSTYVAMTRHRQEVDMYYGHNDIKSPDQLDRILSRPRHKDMALDYAEVRGIGHGDGHSPYTQRSISIERFSKKINRYVSDDIGLHDQGIYRGRVQIGEHDYGILEQGRGVKLIPSTMLDERLRSGQTIRIERDKEIGYLAMELERPEHKHDLTLKERDFYTQNHERHIEKEKTLERDREMDLEL